jgi:hypothetical protein
MVIGNVLMTAWPDWGRLTAHPLLPWPFVMWHLFAFPTVSAWLHWFSLSSLKMLPHPPQSSWRGASSRHHLAGSHSSFLSGSNTNSSRSSLCPWDGSPSHSDSLPQHHVLLSSNHHSWWVYTYIYVITSSVLFYKHRRSRILFLC